MTNLNSVQVTQKVKVISMPSVDSPVGYSQRMDRFLGVECTVLMTDTNGAVAVYADALDDFFYFMVDNLEVIDATLKVELSHKLGDKVKINSVPSEDSFGSNDTMVEAIGSEREVNEIRTTKSFDQVAYGIQFRGHKRSASYFEAANLEAVKSEAVAA